MSDPSEHMMQGSSDVPPTALQQHHQEFLLQQQQQQHVHQQVQQPYVPCSPCRCQAENRVLQLNYERSFLIERLRLVDVEMYDIVAYIKNYSRYSQATSAPIVTAGP